MTAGRGSDDEFRSRIGRIASQHRGVLNRLEPHLGCIVCRGPLSGGQCARCDLDSLVGPASEATAMLDAATLRLGRLLGDPEIDDIIETVWPTSQRIQNYPVAGCVYSVGPMMLLAVIDRDSGRWQVFYRESTTRLGEPGDDGSSETP